MKKKEYYIFSMKTLYLNVLCILIFIGLYFFTDLIYPMDLLEIFGSKYLFFLLLFYFFIHEIIHGISYKLLGGEWKNIVFGAKLESGVFYCLCKQNVTRKNILISIMAPFVLIGVVTYIVGLYINSYILVLLSIANISGCSGDLMMFFYMIKLKKNIEYSEFDNPTQFAIYADYDVSKIKHHGLTFIGKKDELEIKDLKKLTITKTSYIILIILILMSLFTIFMS